MIPITLKIKGFLSYRESVQLDFTGFDVACVIGHNGAGKSSLLDAMTWALFGKARSNDEELINAQETEAEVSLIFDYEAQRYEVVRTKKRGSASKTLRLDTWSHGTNHWVSLTEATNSTTQEKLERILRMDYETFINASFFLQGKADQFAQQRPAERKNTLAKILELEIWDEFQKKASTQRREREMRLSTVEDRLASIQQDLDREDDLKMQCQQYRDQLTRLEEAAQAQEAIVLQLRKQREQAEKQHDHIELLRRNVDSVARTFAEYSNRLAERQAERDRLRGLFSDEEHIAGEMEIWRESQKLLEKYDQLAEKFHQLRAEREKPQTELAQIEAALKAETSHLTKKSQEMMVLLANLSEQEAELQDVENQISVLSEQLAELPSLEQRMETMAAEVTSIETKRELSYHELQQLQDRIKKLEMLDLAECPTCGQPLTADHRSQIIVELRNHGREVKENYDSLVSIIREKKTAIEAISTDIKRLKRIEKEQLERLLVPKKARFQEITTTQQKTYQNWLETDALRLEQLQRVLDHNDFGQEIRAVIMTIDERLDELQYQPETHNQLRTKERQGRQSQQLWLELQQAKAALEPLESEIQNLQQQSEKLEKDAAEARVLFDTANEQYLEMLKGAEGFEPANQKWLQIRDQANQARLNLGGAEQSLHALGVLRLQKKEFEVEQKTIREQIDAFKMLEDAFGKNGVQALMIEQSLPEIENQANEILSKLSSTGMMVQLKTQKEYKDKKRNDLKETLDIVISDQVGVRSYEMYSGGEAFRVNFAIRLALSRMLAGRSGARLQTLVIDEGFGSQDAEGVQRLVEAINAIQDDFAKILVVTHLESLKDAFPAQIEVVKTPSGSQFQVIV